MLTITRRPLESFYIFPEDIPPDMTVSELFANVQIEVTLNRIKGNQVSISIDAPMALTVLRDDVVARE